MSQIPEYFLELLRRASLVASVREAHRKQVDLRSELVGGSGLSEWIGARLTEAADATHRISEHWQEQVGGLSRRTLLISQPLPLRI